MYIIQLTSQCSSYGHDEISPLACLGSFLAVIGYLRPFGVPFVVALVGDRVSNKLAWTLVCRLSTT